MMAAPNASLKKNCSINDHSRLAQPHGIDKRSSTYVQSQMNNDDCSRTDRIWGYLKYHRQNIATANITEAI